MNNILTTIATLALACLWYAVCFGWPIMWLWNNCLIGAIDGIHEIGFKQALGIAILVALLTHKPDASPLTGGNKGDE